MSEPCTSPVPPRCLALVGRRICSAPAKYYWTWYDGLQGTPVGRLPICASCCLAGRGHLSDAFSIQLIPEAQRG